MHRRRFLRGVVATGAVVAAPPVARAHEGLEEQPADDGPQAGVETTDVASRDDSAAAEAPTAPAPWQLLAPLGRGSDVGLGWRLSHLSDIERGAAVLTLAHESGEEARVHLCAIGKRPRGVAQSDHVDLMLMNRGDGKQQTLEPIGRVLKTLANVIRANERSADAGAAGLLPHALRVSYFRSQRCLT